jgi:hypothetical protein
MAKAGTYNSVNYCLFLLHSQTITKSEGWGGSLLPVWSEVHLFPTPLYVLSKYHIIQFTGIELIAKYPLGSQEIPHINCLVKAP